MQAEIDRDEARTIGDNYPRGENTLCDSKKELLFDARAAPSIYSEAPRLTAYKGMQQNEQRPESSGLRSIDEQTGSNS